MGLNVEKLQVTVLLSAHNSEQDVIDRELWAELKTRIQALASEEKFAGIHPAAW